MRSDKFGCWHTPILDQRAPRRIRSIPDPDPELRRGRRHPLDPALAAAVEGRGSVVTVEGPPGIARPVSRAEVWRDPVPINGRNGITALAVSRRYRFSSKRYSLASFRARGHCLDLDELSGPAEDRHTEQRAGRPLGAEDLLHEPPRHREVGMVWP